MDLAGFIARTRELGYDGVELLDFFYKDPQDPDVFRTPVDSHRADRLLELAHKALKETGIACPIFSVTQDFVQASSEGRAQALDRIAFGLAHAEALGAEVLRVFAGNAKPEIEEAQAWAYAVEGLSAAAELASRAQIPLALENHGALFGRSEAIARLLAQVDSPWLQANFDTGNFLLRDEDPRVAAKELQGQVRMVHLKEVRPASAEDEGGLIFESPSGARWVGAALGEGAVPLKETLETLMEAGFEGWGSLEYEGMEDPWEAAGRSLAFLRR